jgi:hypothetical protein
MVTLGQQSLSPLFHTILAALCQKLADKYFHSDNRIKIERKKVFEGILKI